MNNDLIYGKDNTTKIVSIEPNDGFTEVFREIDGEIKCEIIPSYLWILSNKKINKDAIDLYGNLHYKYGMKFNKIEDFMKAKYKLKKYDLYTVNNKKENVMITLGLTYFKDMTVDQLSAMSFDLETLTLDPLQNNAKIIIIGTTYRNGKGHIIKKQFCYDDYETEGKMIEAFCSHVRQCNPSILLGHNIFGFDLKYLRYRAQICGVQLLLGRNGSEAQFNKWESKFRKEASQFLYYNGCHIYGREIVDTMFLSIRYDVAARKYESYGLKNIIRQEKLEKEGRVFYDASKIRDNYKTQEEWLKIKAYCLDDADDALALFDLMIPAFFFMNQSVPMPFQRLLEAASGSQLNSVLIRSYLQKGHSIPKANELTEHLEGGISFGIPGIYKNVCKFDIKSAYPSQILRLKLYDKEKDPEGNFFKMVEFFTHERFRIKELSRNDKSGYYKARDNTAKVFINSSFGLCNTNGLNFNSGSLAAKITSETRILIDKALIWASGEGVQYWRNKSETDRKS